MNTELKDLSFLPYLIEEEIYLVDEAKGKGGDKEIVVVEDKKVAEDIEDKNEVVKKEEKVSVVEIPVVAKASKAFKKVIILVGYQGVIPKPIIEALTKTFSALQLQLMDIEIVNALDPQAKKVDDFTFSFLVLMGGSGKNLEYMQDYTGTRNRYDIATHRGAKTYFAEAMDVYMKPENIELKKKFWNRLKEVFDFKG